MIRVGSIRQIANYEFITFSLFIVQSVFFYWHFTLELTFSHLNLMKLYISAESLFYGV